MARGCRGCGDGAAVRAFGRMASRRFPQQFIALLYKNALVAWRSRRATAIRLTAPFVFLLLALIINLALEANNSTQDRYKDTPEAVAVDVSHLPSCHADLFIGKTKDCFDFLYTPVGDADVDALIERVRANNDPPIPPERVLGMAGRNESDAWMLANGDAALGAVHFSRDARGNLQYILQSNSTVKYFKGSFQDPTSFFQMPLMNAIAREAARGAILRQKGPAAAAEFSWAPRLVTYPHPYLLSTSMLGGVLAAFIFAALMFSFVTQMTSLVSEREVGLRTALRNMGMLDSAYWGSWMAFDATMALVGALLILVFGMVLQFPYFLRNSPGLLLLLFWLFGLAMTSYSYCLSVFMKRAQGAVYLGFVVFVVGWVFQTVQIAAALPYHPDYYYSKNVYGRVFFWVFLLMPWNPLTKAIIDLGAATSSFESPGLRWHQRYSYCRFVLDDAEQYAYDTRTEYRDYQCIYPVGQALVTLLVQWAAYLLLAIYLGNVLPNEVGARRPWYYPLLPSYWFPRPRARGAALKTVLDQEARGGARAPAAEGGGDEDVAAEEERMRALLAARAEGRDTAEEDRPATPGGGSPDGAGRYAAELYGLRKLFRGGCARCCRGCACARARGDFWAIKGTWLGIERGQLFCLLGPNGAGKTTTINCLTGVLPFTGGDALIYGEAISSEGGLDRVRPLMGVCPQFDVLWPELSGTEHLVIYGLVKGVPFSKVRSQARELLDKVKLTPAAGVRSGSYSGGMKRRLSVAIALLGDPQIVYLDEPTTGMVRGGFGLLAC
ncbi:ABC transporter A family member protein [Raphidocelis subcapitata]|uniref:ABC transporter A family member protein n=1 Tax=Raphidocelis subcapitata TaxID=307507 RepID=A0A2V0NLR2_9CHLO|nr:ABC transporter A family member protein [Raphidocelis subcapitata]|eukprot:GBF88378.1 ABC transporter A family member protein [Raphidocelis subcapitata]